MNLFEKKMELSKTLQSEDGLSSNELIELSQIFATI